MCDFTSFCSHSSSLHEHFAKGLPMGSASSGDAIRSINDWAATARTSSSPSSRKPTEDFGSLTFNEEVQRARLPKEVFRSLRRAIAHGEPIDHSVADIIASALKDWAVE